MVAPRRVIRVVRGRPTRDGAGVRLTRLIGTPELDALDPFLLLDEFKSDRPEDYQAGFPDHPHRGFETVTYMLAGSMIHQDHLGHRGQLVAGSVQWMTAGRGIIHSEMPRQEQGLLWGFQLWVNLPARLKMTAPRYQDIPPERIPEVTLAPGARARVVAGEVGGTRGPVEGIATRPLYLDLRLEPRCELAVPTPPEHHAFAYVYDGRARVGAEGHVLEAGILGVLGPGDTVSLATAAEPARLLLLAAQPLGEPVARYGPFVMNTQAELLQAVDDYRRGRFLTGS
jgi:hypothetical protein